MKKSFLLLSLSVALAVKPGYAQNQEPVISGLYAWADVPNQQLHVFYNVYDQEGDELEIFLGVTANNTVYNIDASSATGDLGFPVMSGSAREIVWNYGASHPGILNYKVRVTVDDKYQVDIQGIVDQVDTMNLYRDLQWVSGVRSHSAGLPHLLDVRDSITGRFSLYGLEISTQAFALMGDSGLNIIGRKPGTVEDSVTYINDAHYDGVAAGPAADDNGSGLVGFLEVARILAPFNFRKSIRYIGFDMEESGLIGSLNYVNNGGIQSWERIEGVLNYEMIGYYSEKPNSQLFPMGFNILFPDAYDSMVVADWKGNFITNVACDSASWLRAQYDSITRVFVPELRVISIEAPGKGATILDLRRSDHAPFWDKDIDALMLTDGANFRNLNYHTATDVMDSLNFKFMGDNVKAVIANLCVLAGIQHSDVAYAGIGASTLGMTLASTDASYALCDGQATVSASGGAPPYTFLWNDLSAQTNSTATGLCAGNYEVVISDGNSDSLTVSVVINAGTPSGVEEHVAGRYLSLFPNPTSQNVVVKVTGLSGNEKYRMEVTDEAGRAVVDRSIKGGDQSLTLDVSGWTAGIYNVAVRWKGGSVTRGLIVQ